LQNDTGHVDLISSMITCVRESPTPMPASDDDSDRTAPFDRHLQAAVGLKLKAFYDSIIAEPVPERLKALLDQLEKQETGAESESAV